MTPTLQRSSSAFLVAKSSTNQRDSVLPLATKPPVPGNNTAARSSTGPVAPRQGLTDPQKVALACAVAAPFASVLTTVAGGALAAALGSPDIPALCKQGGVVADFVRAVSYSSLTPAMVLGVMAGFANWMGCLPSMSSGNRPEGARAAASSIGVGIAVASASEFLALISAAVGAAADSKPVADICAALASGAIQEVSKGQAASAFATMGAVGGAAVGLPLGAAAVLALGIWVVCQARRSAAADASNLV
jgi:hypothetical protein